MPAGLQHRDEDFYDQNGLYIPGNPGAAVADQSLSGQPLVPYEKTYMAVHEYPIQAWSSWRGPHNYQGNSNQQYAGGSRWNSRWQPFPARHELFIGNLHSSLTTEELRRGLPHQGLLTVQVSSFWESCIL